MVLFLYPPATSFLLSLPSRPLYRALSFVTCQSLCAPKRPSSKFVFVCYLTTLSVSRLHGVGG
jgi:hypothetical protein